MEEQGIGITVDEFNKRKADGTMAGHVGFAESVGMMCDALGWKLDKFEQDMSKPLKNGVPLPPAKFFDNIDPQPMPVITTEIASGRFEDDIRRMRMAA